MDEPAEAKRVRHPIIAALLDIRLARSGDMPLLNECDEETVRGPRLLAEAVMDRACWAAFLNERLIGYVILRHTFFGSGRITRVGVHPAFRRRGIGDLLVAHAEDRCQSAQLYIAVERAHRPMRALLRARGFKRSGLDDYSRDPDRIVVYAKRVTQGLGDGQSAEESRAPEPASGHAEEPQPSTVLAGEPARAGEPAHEESKVAEPAHVESRVHEPAQSGIHESALAQSEIHEPAHVESRIHEPALAQGETRALLRIEG